MSEGPTKNSHHGPKIWITISGRLGRMDYLASFIFWNIAISLFFLMGLGLFVESFLFKTLGFINIIFCAILVALFLYSLSHLWAITVRRLHDINLSGWWTLFLFVPFIAESLLFFNIVLPATLVCSMSPLAGISCAKIFNLNISSAEWIYASVIYILAGFWWLVIFFIPGTPLSNRFGEMTEKSKKRMFLLIFSVGAMLLIAVLPFLTILFILFLFAQMSGWHC